MIWIIAIFIGAMSISALTMAVIFLQTNRSDNDIERKLLERQKERKKPPKAPALDATHRLR